MTKTTPSEMQRGTGQSLAVSGIVVVALLMEMGWQRPPNMSIEVAAGALERVLTTYPLLRGGLVNIDEIIDPRPFTDPHAPSR